MIEWLPIWHTGSLFMILLWHMLHLWVFQYLVFYCNLFLTCFQWIRELISLMYILIIYVNIQSMFNAVRPTELSLNHIPQGFPKYSLWLRDICAPNYNIFYIYYLFFIIDKNFIKNILIVLCLRAVCYLTPSHLPWN